MRRPGRITLDEATAVHWKTHNVVHGLIRHRRGNMDGKKIPIAPYFPRFLQSFTRLDTDGNESAIQMPRAREILVSN